MTADQALGCGHQALDVLAYCHLPDGTTACYPCADAIALRDLLALEVGQNYSVYVRLFHPHGPTDSPYQGTPGEITTWSGGHLGWMVPGRLTVSHGRGFRGVMTTKFYYRAVVTGGGKAVLVAGQAAGNGMLSNVKRIIDRPHPAAENPLNHNLPPRVNPKFRALVSSSQTRPRKQAHTPKFDFEDREEL